MRDYSILIIGNEQHKAQQIEQSLECAIDAKIEWLCVDALFDGLRIIQERSFDLIISDLFLSDSQGLTTVRHLKRYARQTPIIVLCDGGERDTAVNAVRKGAHDFLCYEDLGDPANMRRAVSGALKSGDDASKGHAGGPDRRTNARFPCRLAVTYQAMEFPFFSGVATSETLNISSKGLLFATEEPLQPGQLLQVSVDWPARLENQVPLKLVAEGRVVRNQNGQAAMRIDKYEFRTRRSKTLQPDASRPEEGAAKRPDMPATAGIRINGGKSRRSA
jgi:ActR/RegA family two-component response regulator